MSLGAAYAIAGGFAAVLLLATLAAVLIVREEVLAHRARRARDEQDAAQLEEHFLSALRTANPPSNVRVLPAEEVDR